MALECVKEYVAENDASDSGWITEIAVSAGLN